VRRPRAADWLAMGSPPLAHTYFHLIWPPAYAYPNRNRVPARLARAHCFFLR